MGRKKKNARHSVHGRKIHVNKYINQCGKTKKCRKSAVSWRPASKETPFNDMPTYQWPTVRTPKQYEVWFAELGDHSGTSVQSGTRPVLVISNDVANRNSPVVTVIPLSSKLKKLELPVHIVLTEKECEMLRDEHLEDSILLVEQITTIDKMVLFNRLCYVGSVQKKSRSKRLAQSSLRCGLQHMVRILRERRSDRYGGYQKHPGGAEDLLPVLCLEI